MTPLWLCLKIASQSEKKAHVMFLQHGMCSLYPTRTVRINRNAQKAQQRTVERALVPGYAFVAHETTSTIPTLHAMTWPGTHTRVVQEVLGYCDKREVEQMVEIATKADMPVTPRLFRVNDAVRMIAGPLSGRVVKLTFMKGKRVVVNVDGREIVTTVDKLEAA